MNDLANRQAIAASESATPHALTVLAQDPDPTVRQLVGANPAAPAHVVERLAKDDDPAVRAGVARNPAVSPGILRDLAEDGDGDVRIAVAENRRTPSDVLTKLCQLVPDPRYAALVRGSNSDVEFAIRDGELQVVPNDLHWTRVAVAANPSAAPDLLQQLARHERWQIRNNVATNPTTPIEILTQLVKDDESYVRSSLCGNPKTPLSLLRSLAQSPDDRMDASLSQNSKCPPDVLRDIFSRVVLDSNVDPDHFPEGSRQNLAFRRDSPVDVLKGLSTHPSVAVRTLIAQNESTPYVTLVALASDPVMQVLETAVSNPVYREARYRERLAKQKAEQRALEAKANASLPITTASSGYRTAAPQPASVRQAPAPKYTSPTASAGRANGPGFLDNCLIFFVVGWIAIFVLGFGVIIWAVIATMLGLK